MMTPTESAAGCSADYPTEHVLSGSTAFQNLGLKRSARHRLDLGARSRKLVPRIGHGPWPARQRHQQHEFEQLCDALQAAMGAPVGAV